MRRRTKRTDSEEPKLPFEGPPQAWETKGIFSDHYIKSKLQLSSLWLKEEEVIPLYEFCHNLWNKRAVTLAKADEQFTRQELLERILPRLGFAYLRDPSMPVSAGRKVPDYLLFANEETKESVLSKAKEAQYAAAIAVLEAKKVNHPLDRASEKETPGRFPHQQIRDYLQEATDIQGKPYFNWAILTSGNLWRLYCRNARPNDYFEFDLEKSLNSIEDFWLFATLFRAQAFVKNGEGRCFLDDLRNEALHFQTKLEYDLRKRVFNILENLAHGFYRRPENRISTDDLSELYQNCLIFLYRLLFILYAEGRGLLPVKSHGVGYNKNYRERHSLQRLIPRLRNYQEYTSEELADLYEELLRLFHLINGDRPAVNRECNVPLYDGRLFDSKKYPRIDQWRIGEKTLGDVLRGLIFSTVPERAGEQKALSFGETIDYADLEVRQLGSIYEGLLENHLELKNSHFRLVGDKAERKATGTYYTPDYIVQYIVKNTIGPLCDEIEKTPEVRKAIAQNKRDDSFANAVLRLNILDPAMGSGHFLVRATEFFADKILNHPTTALQIEKVSPGLSHEQVEIAYWRRRVVESCIYGVDLNLLAVELAKLSLWLTCISSDQPLSFLDHHLRIGNSLIGARLAELNPSPSRDDENQLIFTFTPDLTAAITEAIRGIHNIEGTESKDIATIRDKESKWYDEVLPQLAPYRTIADLLTAVCFGSTMTTDEYRHISELLISKPAPRTERARELKKYLLKYSGAINTAKTKEFFHWELQFPEVFFNENGSLKGNPGFDAVVGNPPYIMEARENASLFRELRRIPKLTQYYEKNMDIFGFFVDIGLDLLKKNSRLSFILPSYWKDRTGAGMMRKKVLRESQIKYLVDFNDFKVFESARGHHSSIVVLSKTEGENGQFHVDIRIDTALIRELQEKAVSDCLERNEGTPARFTLSLNKLIIRKENQADVLEKISGNNCFNLTKRQIIRGVDASPRDHKGQGVFVLSTEEYDNIWKKLSEKEKEFLKPFFTANQIDAYYFDPVNSQWLIYADTKRKQALEEDGSKYPVLVSHLDKFADIMTSSNKPYGLHRAKKESYFVQKNKILFVRKTMYPKFTIVPTPYFVDESVYLIVDPEKNQHSTLYLLSILNSGIAHYWFSRYKTQGAQLQIDKEIILTLPIRSIPFTTMPDHRISLVNEAKDLFSKIVKQTENTTTLLEFVDARLAVRSEESDVLHDFLAFLAQQMIGMNTSKRKCIGGFLSWLEKEIIGDSVNNLENMTKIKEFYADSFDSLMNILKRNRIFPKTVGFSNGRYDKVKEAYDETMRRLKPLIDRLSKTDNLIDQIVYKLYGLTDEEIKIVEERVKGIR